MKKNNKMNLRDIVGLGIVGAMVVFVGLYRDRLHSDEEVNQKVDAYEASLPNYRDSLIMTRKSRPFNIAEIKRLNELCRNNEMRIRQYRDSLYNAKQK